MKNGATPTCVINLAAVSPKGISDIARIMAPIVVSNASCLQIGQRALIGAVDETVKGSILLDQPRSDLLRA